MARFSSWLNAEPSSFNETSIVDLFKVINPDGIPITMALTKKEAVAKMNEANRGLSAAADRGFGSAKKGGKYSIKEVADILRENKQLSPEGIKKPVTKSGPQWVGP